jgi:hypothetical protein
LPEVGLADSGARGGDPDTSRTTNSAVGLTIVALKAAQNFRALGPYSTVTDFARLRGWSASFPMTTAVW